MKYLVLIVVGLSALFQFIAAFMAIRLIRVSGARVAWVFLAAGFLVMGMRRAVTITHMWQGISPGDMTAEILALLISLLLLCGTAMVGPLFARIKQSQDELSKIHQELVESEIRYRTVADFTSDWGFWLAADQSFKYISPSCEQISGYTPEEFYRSPQLMLRIIHPDDLSRYQNHTHTIQENGQPEPIDFRITTRDGQERWLSHVCRPVVGPDGSPLGQRASNRDITERKRAEAELRKSEHRLRELNEALEQRIAERKQAERKLREQEGRLRTVLETLPVGVWIVDAKGVIVFGNRAGQSIWSGARYVGMEQYGEYRGWWADSGARIESEEWGAARAITRGETSLDEEIDIEGFDGTRKTILHSAVPLRDIDQNLSGAVIINQDITERKRAEMALLEKQHQLKDLNVTLEQRVADAVLDSRDKDRIMLQQSRQAAMGEMVGNIAHQWRQPLNTLGLIVQELMMTYGREEFTKESLESSGKRAMGLISHMSKTIEDFRNYFRPDKEKIRFSVNRAVAKALNLIGPSLNSLEITVEVIEKDDAEIDGYPNEYSQVLFNILLNCRDAFEGRTIESQRFIRLTVLKENSRSVVTVADNAGGIPDHIMDKIFDPYFTTKSPDKGTGIGLYMAKAIIEQNMGGRLTVRNTADGAEFMIEV